MTRPLRVLVIEDSEKDARLLIRRLRGDGYDVTADRIDTPEGLSAALATPVWDVIISDFSMPQFSAAGALELYKQADLDIPFIIVSGTASEETAVDMLKAGAHDYVMKNNLARLAPAIQREIAEAHMRRAHRLATQELAEHLSLARLRADISGAIAEGHDLRSVLRGCTDAIVGRLGAAFARIWTLNVDDNVLELQASSGLYTHIDGPHARVPVGQFKIGMIAQERLPHLTNDVLNDPRVSDRAWARREGMVAFAGYPLLLEERLIGVLALFAREPLLPNTLDALGAIARVLAIDIDRRQMEQQLREALCRAEASDRLKSAFLDNMSHEIRTPLHVIIGFNDLIAEELAEVGQGSLHSWFAAIKAASHRLINTVHGILDMAKLQSGTFVCEPRPLRVRKFVEHQIREFEPVATTKGLRLECDVADQGSIIVIFDEYCLSRILHALLDNACKFTRAGTVSVRLYRTDAGRVRIEVGDTGIGISPSELPRIWEPFSQVEPSNTRAFEGAGLGLAVAKKFCALNGAELTVQSELQKGTLFTIEADGFGSSTIDGVVQLPRRTDSIDRESHQ